jgi:hypothetical protein
MLRYYTLHNAVKCSESNYTREYRRQARTHRVEMEIITDVSEKLLPALQPWKAFRESFAKTLLNNL